MNINLISFNSRQVLCYPSIKFQSMASQYALSKLFSEQAQSLTGVEGPEGVKNSRGMTMGDKVMKIRLCKSISLTVTAAMDHTYVIQHCC